MDTHYAIRFENESEVAANIAWAKSEGFDPADVSTDGLVITKRSGTLVLGGKEFLRNDHGEKYLDGTARYAGRHFERSISALPTTAYPISQATPST